MTKNTKFQIRCTRLELILWKTWAKVRNKGPLSEVIRTLLNKEVKK